MDNGLKGIAARDAVNHPGHYGGAAALVAEVERLRHTVADQQMMLDEHRMDNMHAFQEGAEAERAAVVAYLRERHADTQEWDGCDNATSRTYDRAADAIERGEHRREEE